MSSLLAFVKNSVDAAVLYLSPARKAHQIEPQDDVDDVDDVEDVEDVEEVDEVAEVDQVQEEAEDETSPVRNLASELEMASDSVKDEEEVIKSASPRKRGRPPKKQAEATEEGEAEASSPKKRRKSTTTKTPKKTPAKGRKTPAKKVVEESEEEDNTEFDPIFTAGDKVEARFPGDGHEHHAWFNAVILGVLSDSKSYEVTWEDDNTSDKVNHRFVRVRTPEDSGDFADLKTGQQILGFLDPGYWFAATITDLEIKNKKERVFVTWNDISSRKRILSLDEVRPTKLTN